MVGGDGIDRAVGERDQNRLAIGRRAQRRIHLEIRVVLADVLVDQREVMRRDFAGHARLGALAAAYGLQRVGRGKMRHVQARFANLLRERHVAIDDGRFGGRRHAAQSQTETRRSRVHRAILGDARIFRVLHHRKIQLGAEAQRHAHHVIVENRLAVVGDGDRSGALQGAEIGERSAPAAARGGCDRKDVDHRPALGIPQPRHPLRRIDHGRGVGHGANRSESSGGSRGRSAGDGLFVTLARLAQVHVQVDEAGRDDQSARVELLVGAAANLIGQRNFRDAPIAQQDVHRRIDLRRRIDQVAAFDQQALVVQAGHRTGSSRFRLSS